MKKILILLIIIGFFCFASQPLSSQEKQELKRETKIEVLKKSPTIYRSAKRRDPFRDLLAGRDVEERPIAKGVSQISIDDVNLIGIIKPKDKYEALITTPQGLSFTIKVGDKMLDGFVLSISASRVTFRKTKRRGITLYRPQDIVKEINPEER